jgi:hypothetical protein
MALDANMGMYIHETRDRFWFNLYTEQGKSLFNAVCKGGLQEELFTLINFVK